MKHWTLNHYDDFAEWRHAFNFERPHACEGLQCVAYDVHSSHARCKNFKIVDGAEIVTRETRPTNYKDNRIERRQDVLSKISSTKAAGCEDGEILQLKRRC